nr:unnamed protein product [Rangifer tarandus platyrhynchus]
MCPELQQAKHYVCCPRALGGTALPPGPGECPTQLPQWMPGSVGESGPRVCVPAGEACTGAVVMLPGVLRPRWAHSPSKPILPGLGGQVTSPKNVPLLGAQPWVPVMKSGPQLGQVSSRSPVPTELGKVSLPGPPCCSADPVPPFLGVLPPLHPH